MLEWIPGEYVKGEVFFAPEHRVFEGHLPGEPIVPGVILIEAMAQLAGLALLAPDAPAGAIHGYLGVVRHVRFRRRVGPGSRVRLEAWLRQRFATAFRFEVRATHQDAVVAEGEIIVAGRVA